MKLTSAYKNLYLLRLLLEKKCTKNDIIFEFSKLNVKLTKTLINYYIDRLQKNGFDVKIEKKINSENVYFFDKEKVEIDFTFEELNAIDEVKKILFAQKDYNKIRKIMRLFYKIAKYIKDKDKQLRFINFQYFSTLNWNLVLQLEKHCFEKNIITIDYILPDSKNDYITIHADSIKMSKWSNRLYLYGYIEKKEKFYSLPIDRIFMVKKINKKNVPFVNSLDNLTYIVSKEIYETISKDNKETIVEEKQGKITLKRVLDDEFSVVQRLLSFSPYIYYISDNKIKTTLIDKLKSLEVLYGK